MLCIAAALGIVAMWLPVPRFNSDSWSYFELSKSIFSDFYRVNTYRQFETTSLYATYFPPLYPTLLALSRVVCDVGIYTGVFLNAVICVATLFVIKSVVRTVGLPGWVGNVLFLAMLFRFMYILELMAARSIPLAVLLIVAMLRVYVSPLVFTPSRAAALGILAGLSVLTRFDFLTAAMFLGLVLAWYARRKAALVVPIYYVAFALTFSPWVAYSLTHFSKPFASDNSRTVLLVIQSNVVNYYPHSEQLEYVWDAPFRWATNVVLARMPWVLGGCFRTVTTDPTLILLLGTLVGIRLVTGAPGRVSPPVAAEQTSVGPLAPWRGFAAVFGVQLLSIGLTGYADLRYYLSIQFFLSIVIAHAIGTRVDLDRSLRQWARPWRAVFTLFCAAATVVLSVTPVLTFWKTKLTTTGVQDVQIIDSSLFTPDKYSDLLRELHRDDDEPRILVLSGINTFEFGALTGCVTIFKPGNLTVETCVPFVKDFGATHILDTEDQMVSTLARSISLQPTGYPGLVRIAAYESQQRSVEPPDDSTSSDRSSHREDSD